MRKAAVVVTLVLAACGTQQDATPEADTTPAATPAASMPAPDSPEGKIASAESAAPPAISSAATIMDWPAKEGDPMTQLRAGTNGWTCYPASPASVTAAGDDPMCLDPQFQSWAEAWLTKQPPRITATGFGYMLMGDIGASATDPFAMAETPDNQWVRSGPHLMLVVPDTRTLDALPAVPDAGGPWVMWKGTPYAHVMIPVAAGN